jgi:hypothetical protein
MGNATPESDLADEGFTALVEIAVPGGALQREKYLVGCATKPECETEIRKRYPTKTGLKIALRRLSSGDVKGHKLKRGEVKPWQ